MTRPRDTRRGLNPVPPKHSALGRRLTAGLDEVAAQMRGEIELPSYEVKAPGLRARAGGSAAGDGSLIADKAGTKGGEAAPDGFPDQATLEAWEAEALAMLPDPTFWIKLACNLRLAAEIDRRPTKDFNLPIGMTAALSALHRVVFLFKEQRYFICHPECIEPLMRLYVAMLDIIQGRVSPMFKPLSRSKGGSPGKGVHFAIIQGIAARAMTALIEGGTPLPEAAQKVATALRGDGRRGLRNVRAETVTNWREKIMQGEGPGAPRAAVWTYHKPLAPDMGDTPLARADALLRSLREVKGPI